MENKLIIEVPVLDKGYVRYIDHLGTDLRIVESARVSYNSPSKGTDADKKLLKYLWAHSHTSPFEQVSITYNIKLPLFVQAQLVRHRTQRINSMSARYTEMKDEFYFPTEWRKQDPKNKQGSITEKEFNPSWYGDTGGMINATKKFKDTCSECYYVYQTLLEKGIAREMARMILPQNLYTEIYTNFDLHNLMHFFTLRCDKHSQWEIQQYANAMYTIFKQLFPWTAEAYETNIKVS